jgi:hypothetical protein
MTKIPIFEIAPLNTLYSSLPIFGRAMEVGVRSFGDGAGWRWRGCAGGMALCVA